MERNEYLKLKIHQCEEKLAHFNNALSQLKNSSSHARNEVSYWQKYKRIKYRIHYYTIRLHELKNELEEKPWPKN